MLVKNRFHDRRVQIEPKIEDAEDLQRIVIPAFLVLAEIRRRSSVCQSAYMLEDCACCDGTARDFKPSQLPAPLPGSPVGP